MLIFWSLVRNSVVLAVYLLFSVACFLTVHEHYVGDCYKQYECYKHCDMIVAMKEESFNDFNFVSATDKNGKFEGVSLSQAEFINAINNAYTAEFIDCFANNSELKIELSVNYYDAEKQYKKYRKFSICNITLSAEKVTWNWY